MNWLGTTAICVRREKVIALLPLQGEKARVFPVLDRGFKRVPKLFLVGAQPKTSLHALELAVNSRLRPALHELGVRGLFIVLCRGGGGETKSGERDCGGHGGKRPKESAFH